MTHRDRILCAVNHEDVDKIPTDMWATKEVQETLYEHFGIEEGKGESNPCIGLNGGPLSRGVKGLLALWDRLDIDGIIEVRPPCLKQIRANDGDISFNEWGIGSRISSYGEGSYDEQIVYPLSGITSLAEAEAYDWPQADWYDYSALPALIDQCGGRAICCGYSALFTYHNYLRSLELSLMDPILDPELTHYIIKRLSDFFYDYHKSCFEAAEGRIDFSQVTDDWGSQTGLMTSPEIFREFYKQPMQRAIDLAHSFGVKVFHHNDGDMRILLPELVEMGIDILNPVQWRCGDWDLGELKKLYGDKICFHSAVDNQETLPLGTCADVKLEVTELLQTFGSDGSGFIIAPCHNLQPNTSVENILALYESVNDYKNEGFEK